MRSAAIFITMLAGVILNIKLIFIKRVAAHSFTSTEYLKGKDGVRLGVSEGGPMYSHVYCSTWVAMTVSFR